MEISKIWRWFSNPPTDAPTATILLRLMAGGVFFFEGILKFVYVNQGVGRFTKLGMPFPEFTAHFIGVLEIGGGLLLMLGLFTRFFAFLFIIQMIVAILSTKISLYLGTSPRRCHHHHQPLVFGPWSTNRVFGRCPAPNLRVPAHRRFGKIIVRHIF